MPPEPARTIDAEARSQLVDVVDLVRDVLGGDALAAYLYGSAVLGGLKPRSDLDVLVVSRRPTSGDDKHRLIDRLLAISRGGNPLTGARHVELTILVQSHVLPWRYPPRFDFQYGDWLRSEFEGGDITPWPAVNPDVAVLITILHGASEPLFGPPSAEVLDPVPRADLVRATLDSIDNLVDEIGSDTRNVVLTLVRAWTTLETGVIRSKEGAADWALPRVPEPYGPVLARARAVYLGDEAERWDDLQDRVGPFTEHVVGEIRRASRAVEGVAPAPPERPGGHEPRRETPRHERRGVGSGD